MAPALSEAGRESFGSRQGGGGGSGPMDEQGGPEHFLKDSQEMERILGELGGAAEVDLLRVIETMEDAAGGLAGPMSPLDSLLGEEALPSGSGVPAPGDSVGREQARLERRCQFLRRRLRLQQARVLGKHAAEEARTALGRSLNASGRAAARSLVQRLEVGGPGAPTVRCVPAGLSTVAGALRSQLSRVSAHLDSDATLSSSGAESADETVPYNNPLQQTLPIRKRALWKWSEERAWIASRWGWLQGQVQELEHKIRQHAELLRQVRAVKSQPLEAVHSPSASPSGYSGPLPGECCARVRPLQRAVFRKRKLLQMHNLHTASTKAARPSDIRCICQWPLVGCAVCTGRTVPTHPLPPHSTFSKREAIALVDPAFHTVLSTIKEVSPSIHYAAIVKDSQWQQRSSRSSLKSLKSISAKMQPTMVPNNKITNNITTVPKLQHKKRKYNKLKRGRGGAEVVMSRRRTSFLQDGMDSVGQQDMPSGGSSPVPSPSDHYRYRIREKDRTRLNSSYDIDNIVIPHSIAANTKLEILQYKEILTPKWRMIETPNNGIVRKPSISLMDEQESDVEDLSELSVLERHERCEAQERGKYLKKRKNSRRQNSRTTPTQTPPHTPMVVDETSMSSETGTTNPTTSVTVATPNFSNCTSTTSMTGMSNVSNTSGGNTSGICNLSNLTTACSVVLPTMAMTTSQDGAIAPSPSPANKRRPTEDSIEIIPPYSPRMFPLPEDVYTKMLKAMPDNHPLSITESATRNHNSHGASDSECSDKYKNCFQTMELEVPTESEDDSASIAPEEDPTDPEWNVTEHSEKVHHR